MTYCVLHSLYRQESFALLYSIHRIYKYVQAVSTFKLGVGPGHNWGVHGSVRLNSIGLVGVLVGGGSLKWHILVLILGSMLRHMRLNLVGRVLVLHQQPLPSRSATLPVFLSMMMLSKMRQDKSMPVGNHEHLEAPKL